MKFNVLFEPDGHGGFTVSVPDLPGCISHGRSADEAMANIEQAIDLYCEEDGAKPDAKAEGDDRTPTLAVNAAYVRLMRTLADEGWGSAVHHAAHFRLQKGSGAKLRKVIIPTHTFLTPHTLDRILEHARPNPL